ncbi:MAG: PorT family protein [Bacteroidetes bacterium]|nr:PorT family protein [Bacteroidota bacterium]
MKKSVISATVILLSFFGSINAQIVRSYGIKAAYTSATQNIVYLVPGAPGHWSFNKTSSMSGINVAVFAEWFNFPSLSILSQVEYDQRGARLEYVNPGVIGYSTTSGRLYYLSVPIMAKFSLTATGIIPYLIAGPRADFLVGYRDFQIEPNRFPIYSDFKKTMLGWSMGIGLGADSILPVEFRYNFDFFNSYNDGYARIRNNSFDLWLGVSL